MRIIELYKATRPDLRQRKQNTLFIEGMNEASGNLRMKELETMFKTNLASKDTSEDLSAYKLTKSKLQVQLAGIGVSLIDFTPVELCYISIDNINFESTSCQVVMGGGY
jgi:hypothetical protein